MLTRRERELAYPEGQASRVPSAAQAPYARIMVAAVIALVSGILAGLVMPRGPVTTAQALGLLAGSFAVGVGSGTLGHSRWILLIGPALHTIAFEFARLGAVGPTVDAVRFDSLYGVLAFILGRGVYGVLGLLPMLLGVTYGMSLERRLSGATTPPRLRSLVWTYTRRTATALLTFGLVGLALVLAQPASTPPILDSEGQPMPGSVAALERVKLGGDDQWIMMRGASINNPVLLYLSGGPGQSDLPFARVLLRDLEQDFVVVSWDQRGAGKSYPALEPTGSLTLEQAVADTVELTRYLRKRFGETKIYLLGESWGSTLGVLAAQQHPELYYAFIGSGQMVSQRETDRRIWRDLLAYAKRRGAWELYDRLLSFGKPPYQNVLAYGEVMNHYSKLYKPYTPPVAYVRRGTEARLGPWGLLGSEYTLIEKINVLRGLLDMFSVMYPQLQVIDFRRDVPELRVPLFLLDGQAELSARRDLALAWFEKLHAPLKRRYGFANAGHAVAFEQFHALTLILRHDVVSETYTPH